VFIDDVIDRNGRVYFRCHVEETVHLRALEIPDWMLQETCSTTGLVETPVVNCSALCNLKALVDGWEGRALARESVGTSLAISGVSTFVPG